MTRVLNHYILKKRAFCSYFCAMNLSLWQDRTSADEHTKIVHGSGKAGSEWSPEAVLAKARQLIFGDEEQMLV